MKKVHLDNQYSEDVTLCGLSVAGKDMFDAIFGKDANLQDEAVRARTCGRCYRAAMGDGEYGQNVGMGRKKGSN